MIQMLMSEDYNVDRGIVESQRVQIAPENDRVRTSVDDDPAGTIANVDRVALSDIQNTHDELFTASIVDERGDGTWTWFAWSSPSSRRRDPGSLRLLLTGLDEKCERDHQDREKQCSSKHQRVRIIGVDSIVVPKVAVELIVCGQPASFETPAQATI